MGDEDIIYIITKTATYEQERNAQLKLDSHLPEKFVLFDSVKAL